MTELWIEKNHENELTMNLKNLQKMTREKKIHDTLEHKRGEKIFGINYICVCLLI